VSSSIFRPIDNRVKSITPFHFDVCGQTRYARAKWWPTSRQRTEMRGSQRGLRKGTNAPRPLHQHEIALLLRIGGEGRSRVLFGAFAEQDLGLSGMQNDCYLRVVETLGNADGLRQH
jgi:hypothetical protein